MDSGLTAYLVCYFYGYPNKIEWTRADGAIVPPQNGRNGRRFSHHTTTLIPGRKLQSTLGITLLRPQDYGMYTCKGVNEFGEASAIVELMGMEIDMLSIYSHFPYKAIIIWTELVLRQEDL